MQAWEHVCGTGGEDAMYCELLRYTPNAHAEWLAPALVPLDVDMVWYECVRLYVGWYFGMSFGVPHGRTERREGARPRALWAAPRPRPRAP
jgi:hypothetical protein